MTKPIYFFKCWKASFKCQSINGHWNEGCEL